MNVDMLTCRELVEFLWRYLEDELSPSEREVFDRHLVGCASCSTYLETYRTTVEVGQLAYGDLDVGLPAEIPEEVVQGILAARRTSA